MTHFNIQTYENFLKKAIQMGFKSTFPIGESQFPDKRLVIRHDVDFDVQACLPIGLLDASHNFQSCFFFLFDSEFYSIFNSENLKVIFELINLGHDIGIHWDRRKLPISNSNALNSLRLRKNIFEDTIQQSVRFASQHMPTSSDPLPKVEELFEVEFYASPIMKEFFYISDSSMKWRGPDIFEVMNNESSIHFLAHPLWWVNQGDTASEKLDFSRDSAIQRIEREYAAFKDDMSTVLTNRREIDDKLSPRIFKSN